MREIKFRAWDYREEKMYSVKTIYWNNDGVMRGIYDKEREDETGHYIPDCRLELMQYTGLKDKNGVEIYEGDIVKITRENYIYNAGGATDIKEYIKQVQYPFFVSCGQAFGGIDGSEGIPDIVEVIGNVYENPELLEAS